MRMLFPLIPLFLAGCQTRHVAANSTPLPVAETPSEPDARIAGVIGRYTLGAYVDPENELIRHDAHSIQRIEVPARWDLRTGPMDTSPAAKPTAYEPAISRVVAPVTPPEVVAPSAPSLAGAMPLAPAMASTPLPSAPPKETEPIPAITPNADGVIDLTALAADPDLEANPFAVRSVRTDATREISLVLGGVLHGAVPCALINGSPVQPGETVDSLTLIRIEPDAALFRCDDRLIRLPVTAKPARLRVAP